MLSITTQSNYLAKVIKLGEPKKHPNADRLQIWDVDGYTVITDLSSKQGDIKIYFPPECQIHHDIVSKLNLYSDKELNADKNLSGYIGKQRRVKCVKLRDIISEGMLLPFWEVVDSVALVNESWAFVVGNLFDTIDGTVICQKYIPEIKEVRSGGGQGKPKEPKISDILVPGQFNFHYSTSKLQDNIWRFDNPEDTIVITDKWHGTSAVFSNVLTKRKLSIWQKIGRFFGNNIPTEEFSKMYASRSVLKSIEDRYHTPEGGYYNSDIWGKVFADIKHVLIPGITIYGEIVGYTGEKMIQKGYDYGCKPGEHKFLVYRITSTSAFDGQVAEWSWLEIKDFCKEYNLETVKELYYGSINKYNNWILSKNLLETLKSDFLEQDCSYCTTKVPAEGICIRNESTDQIAYKLKSKRFLLNETESLDKGEEVVE